MWAKSGGSEVTRRYGLLCGQAAWCDREKVITSTLKCHQG